MGKQTVSIAVLGVALLAWPLVAQEEASELERTPWGAPDLRGVWDFRTITPLERPEELGEQDRFSSAEAADYEQQTLARRNKDRRTGDGLSAQADVANAYNQFWWDYGDKLTDDPDSFAQPWTAVVPMTRNALPMFEYACHEGNYGMFNLLSGARAEDAEAVARAAETSGG